MISKLPRWVWAGAWILAFIAGEVNVVGLMGFQHETLTHLTGNTSRLAEALARWDLSSALHLDRRYSVVLLLESLLLFISIPLLKNRSFYGLYTAACGIGLQNAMASTYSGAVIRTTHISGMYTDLGVSLGHALRGLPVNQRRRLLCVTVISGFLVGGVVGAVTFKFFDFGALIFPSTLTAIVAIVYWLYRTQKMKLSIHHP